ncbi:MFS transporter [Catenuloplanes atrovinosus]|uniref:MFS family permease n=1 Tax=Catenuloplanes atrovinosus TaxID=137266 RepID=A0AAE3YRK3_9ACTN|nr:MFS transporter [Catenuloplanes atrovinosus]MDR7277044.1 MFS family permease [Catenuloplanes atrovinosus]
MDATTRHTALGRLVPALLVSHVGYYIAVITPVQLLLTLKLTAIAGGAATGVFGVVAGLGALAALISHPIAGRISDRTGSRFGRRRVWILAGAITGAAALALVGLSTTVWQVALLWCAAQTLLTLQAAATSAVVADQVPADRRGGVSGLIGMTLAVGPLAGLALANGFPAGSAAQWTAVAVATAIAGVVTVLLLRDAPAQVVAEPWGVPALVRTFWIDPRRYPAFGWACLVRLLVTCAFAGNTYYAFYLLQRFGVTQERLGPLVLRLTLLSIVMIAVTSVVVGHLSDVTGRQKPFVVFTVLVGAVGLVTLAVAPSLPYVFVSAALLGTGTGAFVAVDLAMCVRLLPSGIDAGRDMAIAGTAGSLPQSLVPFLAPPLLALGGYPALFLSLAVLGLLGLAALRRVPEAGREREAPAALADRPV